jgi:hypothetical protein
VRRVVALLGLLLLVLPTNAAVDPSRKPIEFYFARLQYPGYFGDDNLKNYYTDFPDMDTRLTIAMNRLTGVHVDDVLVPLDRGIFRYPFLYAVEPEQINIDDKQVQLLREWSARGGFLVMDDLHGDEDLKPVDELIHRIWPGIRRVELTPADEIFHTFYNIREFKQAVNDSIAACRDNGCEQWENGPSGKEPKFFGYYTDDRADQMRVFVAYNNDLGDGLEHADEPDYPSWMSLFSMEVFANVIIYSLTH